MGSDDDTGEVGADGPDDDAPDHAPRHPARAFAAAPRGSATADGAAPDADTPGADTPAASLAAVRARGAHAAARAGADGEPAPAARLGVSACLLGARVRFDGGHKQDRYLIHTLGRWVEWVSVCPEFEMGLGAPRETLRLEGDATAPRLVAPRSGLDRTDGMRAWAAARLDELERLDLHGFVLKKNSPSCGAFRVKVYARAGVAPERAGRGIFATDLIERFRLLPVEEEGRLGDARLRENFVERIFAYRRWTELLRDDPTPRGLVRFHTRHKFALLAHSPKLYGELGRLVARAGATPWSELSASYGALFMECLGKIAGAGRHANVLNHLAGHLKEHLDGADRRELAGLIDSYRAGLVPLVVPLTLLQHHFRRAPVSEWARSQTYLDPYPAELMLRNHV